MTLTYFNDINVYFHMKNHYKMLKQVKSVIDTSLPQSLLKSPLAMHSFQKRLNGTANDQLRKIYNSRPIYMPKRGGQVKRHNCLTSNAKSEESLRTGLQFHSTTQRSSVVSPKETLPIRSCSVGPPTKTEKMFKFRQKKRPSVSSARSSNSENQNVNLRLNLGKENAKAPSETPPSTKSSTGSKNSTYHDSPANKSPKVIDNHFLKESSEEHEYLLFLLRITEDIIVNDFYSNNDIKQVFKFHIEANKHRLNARKMHLHIGNLCKELSIDCKEYQHDDDSALNHLNSETPSSYLTNEAFLNCHDCSAIRTSSLYRMTAIFDRDSQGGDGVDAHRMPNGDNDASISPSLLRLLKKLSLGRVTECTEPNPSTSTMNSPNCLISNDLGKAETIIDDSKEKPTSDFDMFLKELNSKEDILLLQNDNDNDKKSDLKKENIALESPPVEIYTPKDSPRENTNLSNRSSKILPQNFLNSMKLSNDNSKSGISEKDTTSFEKYETEFEKSSSSNSTLKCDKSERNDEEKVKQDEQMHEKIGDSIFSDTNIALAETTNNKLEVAEEVLNKNDDNVIIVDDIQPSANHAPTGASPVEIGESNDKDKVLSKTTLKLDDVDKSLAKVILNLSPTDQLEEKDGNNKENEKILDQKDTSKYCVVTDIFNKDSFEPIEPVNENQSGIKDIYLLDSPQRTKLSSSDLLQHQINNRKCSDSCSEKQDTTLKVFLEGSLNDSDYVMIKGPVYIYKPLLESQPKLVVFNDENNSKSRRNSADSQHSTRTFTVDTGHIRERLDVNQQVDSSLLQENVDEAIQFDQSLHSLADDSVENFLELSRRAYSQFSDLKLLQSDYDLTPEKDSDHKYHHLLVDATTSISGVNIKESLLLTDDYLVKSDELQQNLKEQEILIAPNVKDDRKSVSNIDSYLKFEPKLFDNNYVKRRNKKLMPSVSMPKLIMKSDSSGNRSNETLDGRDINEYKTGEMLLGYSSDFINFDIPSQDSSLRSEGETYQTADKVKSEISWINFN